MWIVSGEIVSGEIVSGSTGLEAGSASPVEIRIMLEQFRSNHEEIEKLEQLVMEDLKTEETSPMELSRQGHRLQSMAKSIILKTQKLVETYEKTGAIGDLGDQSSSSSSSISVSSAFSLCLEEVVEYHRKHPCAPLVDNEAVLKEDAFTVEECFGRYLDLHDLEGEGEEGQTESESGDGCKSALKRSTGWDGKPIPYWLDKLGLGQEYKCEICREYSYPGKRAFERHFNELLHRCRLEAGGNLGKGTEGNSSNQAQAPAVAVPPPDIRIVMEKTVGIISETRLEIERKITDLYSKVAGFEFLNSSDEYHAFYKNRLAANRARATDGARAAKRPRHGDSQTCMQGSEFKKVAPMPHKFTCRVPEGITGKELDIIKLTAQFWALYGRSFWEGCSERKSKDPQFEFMMKPGDGRFDLFCRLVEAYMEVVACSRPSYLKEKLRKNPTTDMETVLENCFHRLQWDRFSKKARYEEERARYEERAREPTRTPLSLAQGHLCGMAYMALDPPPKPDPKRQKIDESALVPEGRFLAQNPPGSATVWVFFPKVSGGLYSKITMPSLSEKVASLKDKLSDETTVPPSKLKLSGTSGILKDNMSLAYYNVGAQDVLTCLY